MQCFYLVSYMRWVFDLVSVEDIRSGGRPVDAIIGKTVRITKQKYIKLRELHEEGPVSHSGTYDRIQRTILSGAPKTRPFRVTRADRVRFVSIRTMALKTLGRLNGVSIPTRTVKARKNQAD